MTEENNMKILVGLGNPGDKYKLTRHNIGFMVLDALAKELSLAWQFCKKFNADIAKGENLILVKPQTFMNISGEAVKKVLTFYKLTINDVVVIHDDLDIDFGKHKLAIDSRAAGHNGVQSVIDQLGTQKFSRYRLGVRNEQRNLIPAEKFVLEKFSKKEIDDLPSLIKKIIEELK
ncbi:MAG: Peptidyl-tRNA hydrolase [Parcubacteria group bacterium GW2011_GWE2_39_37]|uniref:Peptidyl-tRNA hydrolase n=1 Tax=Candidatus Falkowbacteria bacterium GW2011_GWF2_39_8 TaxID=1618642 RepID=A0A0G0PYW9_9BACT|nr:MAG: Peptidyl-tRNA hydrolase [Parcubacteria group bacterium GW2011_GWE2_39_37]KKR33349.1 MAG: Peptidyl-tRNA hydrolase [Candidatus Falkowbacteria bacterium GW2011_GWF2_39_8]